MCRINILLIVITIMTGTDCQLNNPLPSVETFLEWLFNTTLNEIGNMVERFDFHDVKANDIKYLLYLKNNKNSTINLNLSNYEQINKTIPTKFIIHGWQANGTADYIKDMAFNYHRKGNYNVIAVDWSEHAKRIYLHASSSTKDVGEKIGDFILKILNNNIKLFENIHIIGHSLGAHISGFAGKKIKEKTGVKIARITGLDTAAPLFEYPIKRPEKFRLSSDDAVFVDGIHTNAGFLGFGEGYAIADYYVDYGGPIQSGCFNLLNVMDSFYCSHSKSHEYYVNTIKDEKYEAISCPNTISFITLLCESNIKSYMGEDSSNKAKGRFYLQIESAHPFNLLRAQ